jgi:hypothetical protein
MAGKTKKRARSSEPAAMELVEEAVHLLRRAPASTLVIYYAGAGAWTLGFLFFWAHTTWFAPSGAQLAWTSLGLAALYVILKVAQAEFCARLMAQRMSAPPLEWTWRRGCDLAVTQLTVHAWGLLLVPVAAAITLPFGWVYAFFQHATVIGTGPRLGTEARALSRRWPMQNHLGLLFLSLAALAVWFNFATAFYTLPMLANRLLGLDNVFGLTGWAFLNTTFFASIAVLSWLVVDPLVKAFYVLRVFHGRAEHSGEDLREELRAASRKRAGGRNAVAALGAILLTLFLPAPGRATETAAAAVEQVSTGARSVDPASLDRALDDVLKRRDFQWQLRPKPAQVVAGEQPDGPLTRFLREGVEMIRESIRSIRRTWNRFEDWVRDVFGSSKERPLKKEISTNGGGASLTSLRAFLYILIGLLVLAIVVVIVLMIRSARRQHTPALVGRGITIAQPDLRDEATHAALMPSEGWLALAKEQIAKGEWRLALRALYLATLAQYAADGLLTLAKFKTNLDYERELRRRAVLRPEVPVRFVAHRLSFESVWYGRELASEPVIRAWLGELEGARPTA